MIYNGVLVLYFSPATAAWKLHFKNSKIFFSALLCTSLLLRDEPSPKYLLYYMAHTNLTRLLESLDVYLVCALRKAARTIGCCLPPARDEEGLWRRGRVVGREKLHLEMREKAVLLPLSGPSDKQGLHQSNVLRTMCKIQAQLVFSWLRRANRSKFSRLSPPPLTTFLQFLFLHKNSSFFVGIELRD